MQLGLSLGLTSAQRGNTGPLSLSLSITGQDVTITATWTGDGSPALTLTALMLDGVDVLADATGTGPWSYTAPTALVAQTVSATVTPAGGDPVTRSLSVPAAPPLALTAGQWSTAPAFDGVPTAAVTETTGDPISQYYWSNLPTGPVWDGTGAVPAGIEPLRDTGSGWVLWWFSDRANGGTIAAADAAEPVWWAGEGATVSGVRIMRRGAGGVSDWSDAKAVTFGDDLSTVAPTFSTAASITGTVAEGETVTLSEGIATGSPAPTLTGVLTLDGADVSNDMAGLDYTIPDGTGGQDLVWTVTASNGIAPDATSQATETVETPATVAEFGALTLTGAGAWPVPGATTTVAKTGNGIAAAEWTVSGLSLVPAQDGVTDGGTVELLVDGANTVTVTINAVANCRSVAPGDPATVETSYAQLEAALNVSQYGQIIRCREGDYGEARNRPEPSAVWWLGLSDFNPAPYADHQAWWEATVGGSYDVDGPIIIEPHTGEQPRHWNLWFRNMHGATARNMHSRMEPYGHSWTQSIIKNMAPLMTWGARCSAIRFENITGQSVLADGSKPKPWDYPNLGAYVSFYPATEAETADLPNCAVVDCSFSGGARDGAVLGGTNFQFERNTFRDVGEDGWRGNGMRFNGLRYNFNRWIRGPKAVEHYAEVSEIEWTADNIIIRFTEALIAARPSAASPAPAPSNLQVVTPIAGGWVGGLHYIPSAAEPYVALRTSLGIDGWNVCMSADNLTVTVPKTGAVSGFPDVDRLRHMVWPGEHAFIGTVQTPGMIFAATSLHVDLDEPRGSDWGENDDIHQVGNLYVCEINEDSGVGEGAGGAGRWFNNTDTMTNMLQYGNVVAVPEQNGFSLHGDGHGAHNAAVFLPLHPRQSLPNSVDNLTKGVNCNEARIGPTPGATKTSFNVSNDGTALGFLGIQNADSPNISLNANGLNDNFGAAAETFLEGVFGSIIPGDGEVTDAMLDAADLYVGRAGTILEGFRATTAYFDPVNRTYDAAAMRAALDAGTYPPDAPGAPTLDGSTPGEVTITLATAPDANGSAITSTEWQLDFDGGDFAAPVATGTQAALTVTPLAAGDYIARARCINANGTGPWGGVSAAATVAQDTSVVSPGITTTSNITATQVETPVYAVSALSSRILIVAVTANNFGDNGAIAMTATWGTAERTHGTGTAMTLAGSVMHTASGNVHALIFYLVNPPTGEGTVQVTSDKTMAAHAIRVQEYAGIDQSTPLDVAVVTGDTFGATMALGITPANAGAQLFWAAAGAGGDERGTNVIDVAQEPTVTVDSEGTAKTTNADGLVYAFASQAGAAASAQGFDLTWRDSDGNPESSQIVGIGIALRSAVQAGEVAIDSLVAVNGHSVPDGLDGIARAARISSGTTPAKFHEMTGPHATLGYRWDNRATLVTHTGGQTTPQALAEGDYDVFITISATDGADGSVLGNEFGEGDDLVSWFDLAETECPGIARYLITFWPATLNHNVPGGVTYATDTAAQWRTKFRGVQVDQQELLDYASANIAAGSTPRLIPLLDLLGLVYDQIDAENGPVGAAITDFMEDNVHLNAAGNWLGGALISCQLFGLDPSTLPLSLSTTTHDSIVRTGTVTQAQKDFLAPLIRQVVDNGGYDLTQPAPVSTGISTMNLSGVHDYTPQLFLDRMKASREQSAAGGDAWATATLNADRYPTNLAGGFLEWLLMWDLPAYDTSVSGRYRFAWDGDGTFTVSGSGVSNIDTATAGQIEFDFTPTGAGGVQIRCTALGAQQLSNMRCVRTTEWDAHEAGSVFVQAFLDEMDIAGRFRFMDWQQTNGNTVSAWADRTTESSLTYQRPGGVPVEVMVRLCHETGVQPWFCIPHLADDAYVTSFATYIRDHLSAEHNVFVEYTNEPWNTAAAFTQNSEMAGLAESEWGWTDAQHPAWQRALQYYGVRAWEIMGIFETVFGGLTRLTRVAGMQTGNNGINSNILEASEAITLGHATEAPHNRFDVVAVTTYYSQASDVATRDQAYLDRLNDNGADDFYRALYDDCLADIVARQTQVDATATQGAGFGLGIAAYEGGTHILRYQTTTDNAALEAAYADFHETEESAELMKRSILAWENDTTGTVEGWTKFLSYHYPSSWGYWGLLRFPGDTNPGYGHKQALWSAYTQGQTLPTHTLRHDAPTGLTFSSVTGSGFTVGATIAGSTANIRYRTGGGAWTAINGVSLPHAVSGLSASTTYDVQVQSINGNGDGGLWSATATQATGAAAPSAGVEFVSIERQNFVRADGAAAVALPAATASDIILAILPNDENSTAEATFSAGWAVAGSDFPATYGIASGANVAWAPGNVGSLTVTPGGSGGDYDVVLVVLSGANTTTPIDQIAFNAYAGGDPGVDAPSVTATADGGVLGVWIMQQNNGTHTVGSAPAGYTARLNTFGTANADYAVATADAVSAGATGALSHGISTGAWEARMAFTIAIAAA